jgi:hypothetical protein
VIPSRAAPRGALLWDEPFYLRAAGCGGFVKGSDVAPRHCHREPVVVGLVLVGEPGRRRSLWRGFACAAHAGALLAARALLPRDQALLVYRREAWHAQLARAPLERRPRAAPRVGA